MWAECVTSGRWPGYQTAHAIEMDCPAWLLEQLTYSDVHHPPVAESDSLELQMSDLDGVTR